MSAFLGAVALSSSGPEFLNPEFLIDACSLASRPGLATSRVARAKGAVLVHRQRFVTAEDRSECQPTPLWKGGLLVFDGRLDDRAGLCEELGVTNNARLPDSKLVALAFEKWGTDAPPHLVGDFALAAFDPGVRMVILATDANGKRPLYLHRTRDHVVFGNCLPSLLALPGVPTDLNMETVADLLANNRRDNRASFYRGVDRVLGGETVLLTSERTRLVDHWPLRSIKPLLLRDDREYICAAREVLDRAVQSCMRSEGPVPLMGSGGLDSACLAIAALDARPSERLTMLTMVPESGASTSPKPGRYSSERQRVEALQQAFPRLDVQFVQPNSYPDLAFAPERIFEEVGVPIRNVVNIGWAEAVYAQASRMGATAFTNGGGGNYTLTWDGLRGLSTLFRRGQWIRMGRQALALGKGRPRSAAGYLWREVVKPEVTRQNIDRKWMAVSCLNPASAASLRNRRGAAWDDEGTPFKAGDRLLTMRRRLTVNRVLVSEFNGWIRARYGAEMRHPLLDVRLVRFCMSIPEEQYLGDGLPRSLARQVLRDAGVPPLITESTSRGEWCPEWFTHMNRRRDRIPAEIELLRRSTLTSRLMDIDKLTQVVANWPEDAAAAEPRRLALDFMLTRALQVGAFVRWAEDRSWKNSHSKQSG
ncbi:MAG TPA: asparagine synthase-related protein [Bryobacteraceae bacterium]|nr:asparagine synthase-related protein [Bryobacteraceae bacterium]